MASRINKPAALQNYRNNNYYTNIFLCRIHQRLRSKAASEHCSVSKAPSSAFLLRKADNYGVDTLWPNQSQDSLHASNENNMAAEVEFLLSSTATNVEKMYLNPPKSV